MADMNHQNIENSQYEEGIHLNRRQICKNYQRDKVKYYYCPDSKFGTIEKNPYPLTEAIKIVINRLPLIPFAFIYYNTNKKRMHERPSLSRA
jgi:hypothetical protein